jgi:hypothetical protein
LFLWPWASRWHLSFRKQLKVANKQKEMEKEIKHRFILLNSVEHGFTKCIFVNLIGLKLDMNFVFLEV